MAFPASVVPSGNSYSVHVAGLAPDASPAGAPEGDLLALTAAAAGALLLPHKVDVRQHLTGDTAEASALRAFLARAGAKASAFSPAPGPGMPGEGFWKTTLAVVRAGEEGRDFWWPPRADKKVEWDCLLLALRGPDEGLEGLSAARLAHPDLWLAQGDASAPGAAEWVRRGAGAAVVFSPSGVTWASRNAAFGKSGGARAFAPPVEGPFAFACGAAGVITGLLEDLLGDNLFDKSWVRVDRADLEARPLRLSRACASGAAAAQASGEAGPERLLGKAGDFVGRVRAHSQAARRAEFPGGEPGPWGSKGRK